MRGRQLLDLAAYIKTHVFTIGIIVDVVVSYTMSKKSQCFAGSGVSCGEDRQFSVKRGLKPGFTLDSA